MRGGIARWKRGIASTGVHQALEYALGGSCDAHLEVRDFSAGADSAAVYAADHMHRFIVEDGEISVDELDRDGLRKWIEGNDPETGLLRGRDISSPQADLILDSTINAPKTFSVAALIDPDLAQAYESLQDRLRDRIILAWQRELNARRGTAGREREELSRIEVVELKHERSRSLDPHKHRHLWLNIKVRGQDGRWSNIDSRVAMKFQTVINAEGDLASRTDPEWISALATKGYTLTSTGEIAELAHVVRPLSRRSNQIEANRAVKLAEWHLEHPGQEPDRNALMMIDRWAWAYGRPNKPKGLDEGDWEGMVKAELDGLDPDILTAARTPADVVGPAVADLDRDFLAACAIVDADHRATATGGRFSHFDVQAGVVRAIAASGVVADRTILSELIEDVTARAVNDGAIDFLEAEGDVPGHIKSFMAVDTAAVKVDLGQALDRLDSPGVGVPADAIAELAEQLLEDGQALDIGQAEAASLVAGTDRLVTVTGPAGTGKTTMLTVARAALANQGRQCFIVAPTKKAAAVAGRETGATASSLHALLVDHGFQFGVDDAGRQTWAQLAVGDIVTATGQRYGGPRRFGLRAGDRIVVDEAGMVDLYAARALAQLAEQTGAGIAMIGDHLQVAPVGHGGAMAMARDRASATTELTAVHRFRNADGTRDDAYARLSLRLRDPGSDETAAAIATELFDTGHVTLAPNDIAVRDLMVQRYFETTGRGKTIALVTSTNEEAQTINERIQAGRLERGQLNADHFLYGQNDQVIYAGDVVQTRKNDSKSDVENRALWTVDQVKDGKVTLESVDQPGVRRVVDADYFARHVHLAYASTVHGIQGETTNVSVTGPGVDAAGLYVGLTRGKHQNEVILTAGDREKAREELVATMRRGIPEVTLEASRAAAAAELGRAARRVDADEDAPLVPWEDRPFGHVLAPEKPLEAIVSGQKPVHESLTRLADRITTDRKLVRDLRSQVAGRAARDHAAAATGVATDPVELGDLVTVLERTEERLTANLERQKELSKAYRKSMRQADELQSELRTRQRLPETINQREHEARIARLRRIKTSTTVDAAQSPSVSAGRDRSGPSLGL